MPTPPALPTYRTTRRWTEKEARAALAALAESKLSIRAFAAREGLDRQRLSVWRRKLAPPKKRAAAVSAPKFLELRPTAAERVEVVLRSGVVLRVREAIEPTTLRRLVEALEQC